jgi:hypothetical protein
MEALSPRSGRWTLTLLAPRGVRVTVDPSWIVFAVLLYWTLDAVVMPFLTPEIDRQAYRFMAAAGALGIFVLVVLREAVVALVAARRRCRWTRSASCPSTVCSVHPRRPRLSGMNSCCWRWGLRSVRSPASACCCCCSRRAARTRRSPWAASPSFSASPVWSMWSWACCRFRRSPAVASWAPHWRGG